MTYKETTDYLFSQLPMYQRQGVSAFKKDLTNIIALCNVLGNPEKSLKCIHIAGTNGKGSVAHIIASVLQAHGLKVGIYTSPHYKDYRERIKINGDLIGENEVISFVENYKKDFEQIQPSFFEITVALAFDYFSKSEVDIAIIETGLGGRLDSTNVINPILSIITNISYDHQSMLGDTLPEIATEKAGIIKANTPVIIGEYQAEVAKVFIDKAVEKNTSIYFAQHESSIVLKENNLIDFRVGEEIVLEDISHPFMADYQYKNLLTSLYAIHHLSKDFSIEVSQWKAGIKDIYEATYFLGRWMIINEQPLTILESAHNAAGIELLAKQLKKIKYKNLHIVWGVANDKDVEGTITLLPIDAQYYFAKADIPRGMPARELQDKAQKTDRIGLSYNSVQEAYQAAVKSAEKEDCILVGGSIFVVAEVL